MKSIAHLLVENNIVRTNFSDPFTWTSGIKSPIYCDCRELISIPGARAEILEAMLGVIQGQNIVCEVVAGTATAGIPWAAFVSQRLECPMLYVRSKPKGHGAGKMVEGRCEIGKSIVVVEDALSTGGSSAKSVQALRDELDAEVKYILAIFSWDTPQVVEHAQTHDIQFLPLTNFEEIITALAETGKINEEEKASLERFRADPQGWGV